MGERQGGGQCRGRGCLVAIVLYDTTEFLPDATFVVAGT